MTRTTIMLTEERIRQYVARHHRLPPTLTDLPELAEDRDSSTLDGWGRPIGYAIEGEVVTLVSLGRDGLPGGDGEDCDVQTTFTVSEPPSEEPEQEDPAARHPGASPAPD